MRIHVTNDNERMRQSRRNGMSVVLKRLVPRVRVAHYRNSLTKKADNLDRDRGAGRHDVTHEGRKWGQEKKPDKGLGPEFGHGPKRGEGPTPACGNGAPNAAVAHVTPPRRKRVLRERSISIPYLHEESDPGTSSTTGKDQP